MLRERCFTQTKTLRTTKYVMLLVKTRNALTQLAGANTFLKTTCITCKFSAIVEVK